MNSLEFVFPEGAFGPAYFIKPEEVVIAIPSIIQYAMDYDFKKRYGGNGAVHFFNKYRGMQIVPGYEMKIVVFHIRSEEERIIKHDIVLVIKPTPPAPPPDRNVSDPRKTPPPQSDG